MLNSFVVEDPINSGEAVLELKKVSFPASTAKPLPIEICDITARLDSKTGEITLSVSKGEKDSLYQFVFGSIRLEKPGSLDGFIGDAWIDPSSTILDVDEQPLRLRVTTDRSGSGSHVSKDARINGSKPLIVQAIGLTHLTTAVNLEIR